MKRLLNIVLLLSLLIISCHKAENTTNQDIYDFMQIVIKEQKLDISHGIDIIPIDRFSYGASDSITFNKLLFNIKNNIQLNNVTFNESIYSYEFHPLSLYTSLSKEDILKMKYQKEKLVNFKWDNSRLGFNQSNDQNWYAFSVPLFSEDKNQAVIMIKDLCLGLCGNGKTILFTKKNNKWTSSIGIFWYH